MIRIRAAWVGLLMTMVASSASADDRVDVFVPDGDNLQHLSFWVAKGGGFFRDEGLDVQAVIPSAPREALERFRRGEVEVAVLPPPLCLELIAERTPIVLVANLLANDPINLVVRRSVLEARRFDPTAPLDVRLRALRGLRIGIAPNPPPRLRALFASQSLDAESDVQMVILGGRDQNRAFGEGEVDALYAHTPFLETALVDQDAVLVVNQSAGEVPELAHRQIHALVVTKDYALHHADRVQRLVRAIDHAEQTIRSDHDTTLKALRTDFPSRDPRKLDTVVRLYAPAVPETPRVSADGLRKALALFPSARPAPLLEGVDLAPFVDDQFAERAVAERTHARAPTHVVPAICVGLALALVIILAITVVHRRSNPRR